MTRPTLTLLAVTLLAPAIARAEPSPIAQEVSRLLASPNGTTSGTLEGFPADYRIETSGRYHDQATTMLSLKVPSPALRLLVRRVRPGEPQPKDAVDVKVNDAPFDDAFVVEGAPSDLVRALLDEPLRRALAAVPKVYLAVDGSFVQVSRDGTLSSPEEARQLVAIGAMTARHLRDGVEPAPGAALSPADRDQELAHLRAVQSGRQRNAIASVVPAFLVGALMLGAVIWNVRRRRRRR